ncbi:MAG: DUF11 domain-containing protein [SAR202 cluster bacterium]|nr:DUF11 domain-containing protein [SAR202 cluster bacterium]
MTESPLNNRKHIGTRRSQRGSALTIALAFMVFAVPVVVAGLTLASTLLLDSRVKLNDFESQYTRLGASILSHHLLTQDAPTSTTTVSSVVLNGTTVTTTIVMNEVPPGSLTVPAPSEAGREFRTEKSVHPTSTAANVDTTFTYTITVTNMSAVSQTLTGMYDNLPSGFDYITGSSSGVTTANPTKSGQEIRWLGLSTSVPSGDTVTQIFQVTARRPAGVYCNEAWVTPGGYEFTTSGLTADVKFGSPSSLECPGKSVRFSKAVSPSVVAAGTEHTFHYSISMQNRGNSTLVMNSIEDLLPAGFTYVTDSAQGLVFSNPTQTSESGRTRLTWTGSFNIPAGGTVTQELDAVATPAAGDHWNEAWGDFSALGYTAYTWPSARVEALTAAVSTTTDGHKTFQCVIWIRAGKVVINSCNMQ